MADARTSLSKYFKILEENEKSQYLKCKHIPVSFENSESTKALWKKHDTALNKRKLCNSEPKKSLLDLKIELASRIFQQCCFCERKCKVNRRKKSGNCGVQQSGIASEFLHLGEEAVLVPSYTVFFSGCTFHCVFCQNWDISQYNTGMYVEPSTLANMIERKKTQGAKNVNWVGGDPTPNLPYILQVLKECELNIPQVWNSNMYCSIETMKLLAGVIDVYLTDFKYGNDDCAKRLSKVDNYMKIVKRNHKIAHEAGEMIIRHLVLPNHIDCCSKPIIKWIAENLPNTTVNIMAQYRPEYKAYEHKEIARPVSSEEVLQVKEYADHLGILEV
jgi:putative pyruvate formate lyase activating enzyme